jgi:hypothetical protein
MFCRDRARPLLIIGLLALVALLPGAVAVRPNPPIPYAITDLGTLGGGTVSPYQLAGTDRRRERNRQRRFPRRPLGAQVALTQLVVWILDRSLR